MPRGDKTGPNGEGPKTGRGLGPCTTTKIQNANMVRGPGRGRGRGPGPGRGRGRGPVNNAGR